MRALRTRSKSFPPPARYTFEALSDPVGDQRRRAWLHLEPGEMEPRVLRAEPHAVVEWASLWPDRPDDVLRFDVADEHLTWALLGEATEADEPRLDELRRRIDRLVHAGLRESFGQ